MAPPGEEGWTIRHDRAILHSEPYASADLGAASDVDRQVFTVRGYVGLFAEPDLTPTPGWRHLIDAGAKRPWSTPSAQTRDKAGQKGQSARTIQPIQCTLGSSSAITSRPMCTVYAHFFVATNSVPTALPPTGRKSGCRALPTPLLFLPMAADARAKLRLFLRRRVLGLARLGSCVMVASGDRSELPKLPDWARSSSCLVPVAEESIGAVELTTCRRSSGGSSSEELCASCRQGKRGCGEGGNAGRGRGMRQSRIPENHRIRGTCRVPD